MGQNSVITLLADLGSSCPNIISGIELAHQTREEIAKVLSENLLQWVSLDTSFVVFGSLARNEFTRDSDVDWTYLIDGQANSEHLTIALTIQDTLAKARFKSPNQQGAFGRMMFSHSLIHQIGGAR